MLASEETLVTLKTNSGPHAGVSSSTAEKSKVVLATTGTIYRALVTNTGVADAYLFILDAASLPADGALPAAGTVPILVSAGSSNGDEFPGGLTVSTGCVLALSSTVASLTLVASNVGLFSAIKG